MQVERVAECPQHGHVVVELERLMDPPVTFGYHQKDCGRWHRFRVHSWQVRPAHRGLAR